MERRQGFAKQFHDYSRASRNRIRRALRNARRGVPSSSSSSEDEAPVHHRDVPIRVAPRAEASNSESASDLSAAEGPDDRLMDAEPNDDVHQEELGDRDDNNPSDVESDENPVHGAVNDSGNDEPPNNDQEINRHVSDSEDEHGSNASDAQSIRSHHDSDIEHESDVEVLIDEGVENDNGNDADQQFEDGLNQPPEDFYWNINNNVQLYDLAPITLGESMFAVLSFFLRHNLSLACLSDLLSLINLHCRQEGNNLPRTLYSFKKFFHNIQFPVVKRFYCSVCYQNLTNENEVCENCNGTSTEHFVEISILSQLRALYQRPDFVQKIGHRFNRRKFNDNNIEEIYDGNVYRELTNNDGPLSDPRNISLMWYTDGVSLFRSSRYEIWPFYFVINELPFNERTKVSNALLAGLWFGKKKPNPTTFLNYIRHDMTRLRNGIDVLCGNPPEIRNVRGIVVCGTADLPAKAKFLNMKGHKAEYGCNTCKIRSHSIRRGVNVYHFRQNLELRTEEETQRYGLEAIQLPLYNGQRQDRIGVKGPSVLAAFVHQHVRTTAVDVMHCAFINLPKALLQFWFDIKFRESPFSLRAHKSLINTRLSSMNPPSFVQRLTRSLDDVTYWRAHEYKSFIFYYSLPVLADKMSELYLEHHKLLVLGLYLLNQRSISNEMIEVASDLLSEYVSQFEVLYGIEAMTCNLHQLLHLAKTVQDLGPLWTTSCFPFEDLNGKLKKLVKGSRHAELQVCSGISMLLKYSELRADIPRGRVYDFAEGLFDSHRGLRLTNIDQRMAIVGNYRKRNELAQFVQVCLERENIVGRNYYEFYRLLKYCFVYASELYTRLVKTKSFCVKYSHEGNEYVGFINHFLRVTNCDCENFCLNCNPRYVALIRMCHTQLDFNALQGSDLSFIHTLMAEGEYFAVDVSNIISLCFVVSINDQDKTYLIEPVNLIEPE